MAHELKIYLLFVESLDRRLIETELMLFAFMSEWHVRDPLIGTGFLDGTGLHDEDSDITWFYVLRYWSLNIGISDHLILYNSVTNSAAGLVRAQ